MVVAQALVEQPDLLPDLAGDQDHAGPHRQHVQDPIELPLVDLAGLQGCVRVTETIGGPADVAELTRVLPVHDLRAHDTDPFDAFQLRRFDETLDRLRIQRHVIAKQQDEISFRGHGESDGAIEGARRTQPRVVADDAPRTQGMDEELVRVVRGAIVDRDDAHPLVRL